MKRPNSELESIALIIPVYKQASTIKKDLQSILGALRLINIKYEIICVIDGLVDDSVEKIASLKNNNIRLYSYPKNRGKSYALRYGVSKTDAQYIMFLDSGMEIDPQGISMLLEHMRWYQADIIVGSKRHPVSLVKYPFFRRLLSYGYYYLVKILFGIKVSDTQAGIKLFRHNVIQEILPLLKEEHFIGDLEILVVSNKLGFNRIYEAPIRLNYHLSNITSAATLKSIFQILFETILFYFRAKTIKVLRK